MIRKTIPDTFSGSVWSIHLQPSDVSIPKGTDVQVAEIAPRDLDVLLDSVGKKDVRIVPLVRVEAESGYVLRGLSIVPSVARVVGPEKSLAAVESITTLPTVISSVNGPFFRTRSEEHTSELQSQSNLVCRLLLEKKKKSKSHSTSTKITQLQRCSAVQ